jgi:hypothetical protein
MQAQLAGLISGGYSPEYAEKYEPYFCAKMPLSASSSSNCRQQPHALDQKR